MKTITEIKIEESNSRENLKRFSQFNWFISQVKAGKKVIILAPDYVVVDWKTWENLNKKQEKPIMFFDEAGEITEEMWKLLEKRLAHSNAK